MGTQIEVDAYMDSKTLPNLLQKMVLHAKSVKNLYIRIKRRLRRGELSKLNFKLGKTNPADGLTKAIVNETNSLWNLITTEKLKVDSLCWVTLIET